MTWRPGRSHRRIKVGVVKSNANSTTFKYDTKGVKEAEKYGFKGYPAFPDLNSDYSVNVLQILSQRLINPQRKDKDKYFDFWEIPSNERDNNFLILALTGGILPTDTFEFLPEFYSIHGLNIISDIAGLSTNKYNVGILQIGDELKWEKEPNNPYDKYAISLYKDGKPIGYVKKIHNLIFKKSNSSHIKITVKRIEGSSTKIDKVYICIKCL